MAQLVKLPDGRPVLITLPPGAPGEPLQAVRLRSLSNGLRNVQAAALLPGLGATLPAALSPPPAAAPAQQQVAVKEEGGHGREGESGCVKAS